jgi:hypothetical protein
MLTSYVAMTYDTIEALLPGVLSVFHQFQTRPQAKTEKETESFSVLTTLFTLLPA